MRERVFKIVCSILLIIALIILWIIIYPPKVIRVKSVTEMNPTTASCDTQKPNKLVRKDILQTVKSVESPKFVPKYKTFIDDAYDGYIIIVPYDFIEAEVLSGDCAVDREYNSKDKNAKIAPLVMYSVEKETVEQEMESDKSSMADEYQVISQEINSNFYILGFQNSKEIVYKKTYVVIYPKYPDRTYLKTLTFRYPVTSREKYEPLVNDILKGFRQIEPQYFAGE